MESPALAHVFAPLSVPTAYTPDTASVGGSLVVSALVALIPLTTFFVLLGLLRLKAWMAGLGALAAAVVVAVLGFGMPAHLALLSATEGGVYGLFPIMWIVVCAVWLYQLTVVSGRFDDLRAVFDMVGGGDRRVQAMLIAFCFGGLLEALAGFGAPVAITGTMLLALGIAPLRAAMAVLVANTAPVAFGAMAIPITTAAGLTNIPGHDIAAIVGRQTPVLAAFVPLLLLFLVDGRRGLRQCWPIALVTGLTFAVLQFLTSNFFTYELTDIVAALGGLAAAVVMLRFWRPTVPESEETRLEASPHGALTGSRIFWSVFPYLAIIVVFGIAKLWKLGVDVPAWLSGTDVSVHWPVLDEGLTSGAIYKFTWLSNPGTLLFITGILVTVVLATATSGGRFPLSVRQAARSFVRTVVDLRISILTVASVLALAYVMNQSGQTLTIGTWAAASGAAFALVSPMLGWLGTAVTGSDTSANALFAQLQQTAAQGAGLDPNLLVAANSSGGVVGKMVSPQNLTIAAASVKLPGEESRIFRAVFWYSIGMLAVVCLLVFLQSTPVLDWMIP